MDVTDLENGNVLVSIKSKRGTGTRDEDEITVKAVYGDLDEAERESGRMNQLVADRMADAREVGSSDGTDEDDSPTATENESGSDFSKVYLGEGSRISGWVPVPKDIVFQEIVPRVKKNEVNDEYAATIQVNFSKDVPTNGWTEVDAQVVSDEIEPLVRRHRLDKD